MRDHLRESHVLHARTEHGREHNHFRCLLWVLQWNMFVLALLLTACNCL